MKDDGELSVTFDGGQRILVPGMTYTVGRGDNCDIVIDHKWVSRRHALFQQGSGGWELWDLDSTNGVFLGREKVGRARLTEATQVRLGGEDGPMLDVRRVGVRSRDPNATRIKSAEPLAQRPPDPKPLAPRPLAPSGLQDYEIRIGRSPDNDICLKSDLLVSRRHASITVSGATATIRDLGSANGTFVNGQRVQAPAALRAGDCIGVGNQSLTFDGQSVHPRVGTDKDLVATDIRVKIGDKTLLSDVSFNLPAKTLMAVVGPSGAGKSTLLGALTGQRPADSGSVSFAGRDLIADYDELRSQIGLVPQADILHTTLTTRRALQFGAKLRFPTDTTREERSIRIEQVLAELGLTDKADLRIDKLSGGQRKRTSVALELLTKPSLLFLDEPTSGLDVGLDRQVMLLLRRLADDDRIVVVVTHSVANLEHCDQVMVLAPGGHMAFVGPPDEAITYFKAQNWQDVFDRLTEQSGQQWSAKFAASPEGARAGANSKNQLETGGSPHPEPAPRPQSRLSQAVTLAHRYLAVIASDRGYLALLAAMPLLLAGLAYAVGDELGLSTADPPGVPPNPQARSLLLVMLLGAVFMGTAASIQEVVKERAIFARERAIGVSPAAYLAAKQVVLGGIAFAQAVTFTGLAMLGRPGPASPVLLGNGKLELGVVLASVALVSTSLGLSLSTRFKSAEAAMPMLVVLTMAQVILSGAVPIGLDRVLNLIGWAVPAYWGMAAMAGTTDLNYLAAIAPESQRWNWSPEVTIWLLNNGMAAVWFGVLTALGYAALRRTRAR